MFLSRLNDPNYCLAQAETARTHAALRQNLETKTSLLKIADGYIRIARSVNIRAKSLPQASARRKPDSV